jgi:hypothetical protein
MDAQIRKARVDMFSSAVYNDLPEVEHVDAKLRQKRFFEQEFSNLASIFRRYNVSEYVGICLLHNHNMIRADEAMVQRRKSNNRRGEALITAPRKRNGLRFKQSRPWSFAVSSEKDGVLLPIEFSNDNVVRDDYTRLLTERPFIEEFCRYISDQDLGRYIGLALIRRSFEPPADEMLAVEDTDPQRRTNTVYYARTDEYVNVRLIQTIYPMIPSESQVTRCVVRCWMSSYCVVRSPGHARETSHGRQHRRETET